MRVMIVDDEPYINDILKRMIEKEEGFQVVSCCIKFADAISDFVKLSPDVVFMDIDLNGESGIDCAKAMININPLVKIIFATAHSEYMANAFEMYAFDYLVKPFDLERLRRTLRKLFEENPNAKQQDVISTSVEDKLMIRGKEQINFVPISEIIMIERTDGNSRIITKDAEYKTTASLTSLEERLKATNFMRCHKSYIINLNAIKKLEVYGRWTYTVSLEGTDNTALMTYESYEEIKQKFSL